MSREALLVILCAVFRDVALRASPPQGEREAIALCDISRSARDTAQPSSRGEGEKPGEACTPLALLLGRC